MTIIPETLVLPLATRHGCTANEARDALTWARDMPTTMDFPQEARRAAHGEGELDLVWMAWQQHRLDERAALMRKATRTNDWVGAPNVYWTGQLIVLRTGPTADGKTYFHCRDDKGRWVRLFCKLDGVEAGHTIKVRAQVKAHETYKGARVTSMRRAEVLRAE